MIAPQQIYLLLNSGNLPIVAELRVLYNKHIEGFLEITKRIEERLKEFEAKEKQWELAEAKANENAIFKEGVRYNHLRASQSKLS